MLENFTEQIMVGMNNPECSFFVGGWVGAGLFGMLFIKILIYFYLIKLLDKIIFKGFPCFVQWIRKRNKEKNKNENMSN